ncbi:TPA: hypothetical protein ACGD64_002008 [Serratia marcescens]|uniref:hypothetical protein n=1 Tax=Enterobacterales TaxID=91347 RepID=UPI000344B478|nr:MULTISPECIES: hypothetical protein [Enterobacterales]
MRYGNGGYSPHFTDKKPEKQKDKSATQMPRADYREILNKDLIPTSYLNKSFTHILCKRFI